jgi:hypothetical protein
VNRTFTSATPIPAFATAAQADEISDTRAQAKQLRFAKANRAFAIMPKPPPIGSGRPDRITGSSPYRKTPTSQASPRPACRGRRDGRSHPTSKPSRKNGAGDVKGGFLGYRGTATNITASIRVEQAPPLPKSACRKREKPAKAQNATNARLRLQGRTGRLRLIRG